MSVPFSIEEMRIPEFLARISADLDRCVAFWLKHSHDEEFGGFFACLGKDGKIYDDLKYGWLQGRQVWTYAKLYNEVERFRRPELLKAAVKGADFMIKHVKEQTTGRCYFVTTRDGKPIKQQRTIFTECFYVMGMSEVAKATKQEKYKQEALSVMTKIIHWVRVDDSEIGNAKLAGVKPTNSLAVPMILLGLIHELTSGDESLNKTYEELEEWCVQQVLSHVQREGSVILENVSPEGKEMPGSMGRLMNPGHAIECGWFLLQYAIKKEDRKLQETAIEKFIINPFNTGWDVEHEGLFYFLDVDGLSPTQLEWNMKLWWPHNEAMIAFLMAYDQTQDQAYLERFAQVYDYSMKHFSDVENGEWYGYLNQEGQVNMDFKGGPFKGCFHVPRCLMMCEQMLTKIRATLT
ncbi:N-acylglucosamine 2-epimerase isoform X1 [Lingula anatina]|uniref:N-acylglucosamine 2-epimerase n=1 Tax=Lingula anatina TaxID=7574 RepID=A0A1S3H8D2_LINAN|nr:N-acylglucosamine 2-epimerase isoform X1 [Lingula anatina]XP_013382266.1 N-acylglucosamine 2-epimerase isoform X1 [Lingula anatina]|eukprot:XP_013382258.1 N-acylglucosamine 2-epimerase isoform X1 [Lingula anatina]